MYSFRSEKGSNPINLKVDNKTFEIFNLSYLVISNFLENTDSKISKASYFGYIIDSVLNNESLKISINDKSLDFRQSYLIAKGIIHLITFEIFYFSENVDEEIKFISECITNSEIMSKIREDTFISKDDIFHFKPYDYQRYIFNELVNSMNEKDVKPIDNILDDFIAVFVILKSEYILTSDKKRLERNLYTDEYVALDYIRKNHYKYYFRLIKLFIHEIYHTDNIDKMEFLYTDNKLEYQRFREFILNAINENTLKIK